MVTTFKSEDDAKEIDNDGQQSLVGNAVDTFLF